MISPSIWEDPAFNKLSIPARLLFIGMFSNADDEGFLRGDVGSLKRLVFGFDMMLPDLEKWVMEVMQMKNLHFYEVEGENYCHFVKWDEYQKQQKDRIQDTMYPKCSICLANDKQVPTEVKGSKEKESKDRYMSLFEKFWNEYPRHESKKKALDSFIRIKVNEPLLEKMLATLKEQKQSDQWLAGGGKFIPHPTTWLNQERWNDEVLKCREKKMTFNGQPARNYFGTYQVFSNGSWLNLDPKFIKEIKEA